jgi:outer membrane protein assembly factor BamB
VFQTEGSRRNLAALSKSDGKPNYEAAFTSNFYDDMLVGIGKMHAVGTILSSPVISGNVVYVGSADGSLYALQ